MLLYYQKYMKTKHLIWTEENRREEYRSKVFSIWKTESTSPEGKKSSFSIMDCPDWVIVVPVLEINKKRHFVMVHQWRHGTQELSMEFPGGVLEEGENPETGARREFEEETAYKAEYFIKMGALQPNPAIMTNTIHIYLAEKLSPLKKQMLDEDEFVDVKLIGEKELIKSMGTPPYIHSLSAAALALYMTRAENRV